MSGEIKTDYESPDEVFKEPWRTDPNSNEWDIFDADLETVASVRNLLVRLNVRETAARICACVNFCREIPTHRLLGVRIKQPPMNATSQALTAMCLQGRKIAMIEIETDPEELEIAKKLRPR